MVTIMQVVFNELSTSSKHLSIVEVNQLISAFVKTYTKVINTHPGIHRSIATPINLNDLELSPGYYLAQWRNDPTIDREEKRRFLGLCDRQTTTTPGLEDLLYVQFGDYVGMGLQIAYEQNSPVISFQSEDYWKHHEIGCTVCDLENEEESEISLINLASEESVIVHREWIEKTIQHEYAGVKTSAEFLAQYEILFPSLRFHRNALAQMKNQIRAVNIPTIVEKLLELEKYFSTWDGGKFDRTVFPPRFVSPESEETLTQFEDEHTFEWEGHRVLVSFHVRYTGGDIPGRIYIYPDHETKKCIIFSMNTKLPTVSDPKG